MHPALRNLEVICTISSYTEHGSLPALASTCREFEHPALDVLWRNLQSMAPLVSCLPSGLFASDDGYWVLQKPPDGKVWDTLFKYASRVHSITATSSSSTLEPLSLLMLSCPSTPASFFPKLRKLTLHDDGARSTAEFLRMAFVPSLVELNLQIHAASSPALPVLSSLGALCPHLQCMAVKFALGTDNSLISPFITQPVSQLHHLHTLSVCDLGNKGMEYLMQLRALQSLSLDFNGSSSWDTQPDMQFPGFHDLKWLGLSTRTVGHALNFFSSLQIIRSKEIKVEFVSRVAGSAMLSQLFAILQERCDNDKLESFSLVGSLKRRYMESGILTSLHAFRNLTQLVIEKGYVISMSDEELCQLVRAWPKLQVLKFSRYVPIDTIVVPTFHGLIELLRLCPALTSLALVVDATKLDGIYLKCPGGGSRNKRLRFLSLGNSSIESPLDVALILSGLFPRLERVNLACWHMNQSLSSLPQKTSEMEQWELVNNFLGAFSVVKERCIEELSSDCA